VLQLLHSVAKLTKIQAVGMALKQQKRISIHVYAFLFFFIFFILRLDGLPLPTTPSTKKTHAGQLSNRKKIESWGLDGP